MPRTGRSVSESFLLVLNPSGSSTELPLGCTCLSRYFTGMNRRGILRHSFSGGFRFTRYEGQPAKEIATLPIPREVTVPMLQGFGLPVAPLVKPGDTVKAGQLIGRDDGTVSSPVHATAGGTVTSITTTDYLGRVVPAVTIRTGGPDDVIPLAGASRTWQNIAPDRIGELLYLGGVTGLGREGFPTKFRSATIRPDEVRHLIVVIPGADAFNVHQDVLVPDEERLLAGTGIMGRALPGAKVHLAASGDNHRVLSALARRAGASFHSLTARYPQDSTELLVTSVLGEEFPFGYGASSIGVTVADSAAALAAYDAVVEGRPVLERVIALSGPGFASASHVRVRVGSPFEHVVAGRLKDKAVRLVRNSLLSGNEVTDLMAPAIRTDSQLIALPPGDRRAPCAFAWPGLHRDSWSRAFLARVLPLPKLADTNVHGDERPCINCGWCARVCPVRIIPHLITRMANRTGIDERLVNLNAFNCIDCNLCTFVCPSKIPLARQLRDTKERLLEAGCDNSSCILPKFDLRGVEEYKGVKSIR